MPSYSKKNKQKFNSTSPFFTATYAQMLVFTPGLFQATIYDIYTYFYWYSCHVTGFFFGFAVGSGASCKVNLLVKGVLIIAKLEN